MHINDWHGTSAVGKGANLERLKRHITGILIFLWSTHSRMVWEGGLTVARVWVSDYSPGQGKEKKGY